MTLNIMQNKITSKFLRYTHLELDRRVIRAVQFLVIPTPAPFVVCHLQHFPHCYANKPKQLSPNTMR